jgi:endonuclease YncB( thermonuclease family)
MTNKYHEKELEKNNFDDLDLFSFDGLVTKCKVVDIYDGDTVTIVFYYGNSPLKVKFRMLGYDTPEVKLHKSDINGELHKKAGLVVKEKLKAKILHKIFWVKFDKEEKYGRTMGELYEIYDVHKFTGEEKSINKWVIDNKYGKVYSGGKKEGFTQEELEHIIKN